MPSPRKPCRECGGVKPPGSGVQYCDDCAGKCPIHGNPAPRANVRVDGEEYCPKCRNAYMVGYLRRNPQASQKNRDRRKLNYFGISPEELEELKRVTACQSCGDEVPLVIDHCHTSGKVRGMLCDPCNKALGFVRDDPERLRLLIKYLEVY